MGRACLPSKRTSPAGPTAAPRLSGHAHRVGVCANQHALAAPGGAVPAASTALVNGVGRERAARVLAVELLDAELQLLTEHPLAAFVVVCAVARRTVGTAVVAFRICPCGATWRRRPDSVCPSSGSRRERHTHSHQHGKQLVHDQMTPVAMGAVTVESSDNHRQFRADRRGRCRWPRPQSHRRNARARSCRRRG